jgi:predicted outer membrane protein
MARWTVALAVLTGLAVAVWIYTAVPSGTTPSGGYTRSASGPVGPEDRALLVTVRQATLWELPVVQQARLSASDPRVQAMSSEMVDKLDMLDEQVRMVAARLQVPLPNQPSAEQQSWAGEVSDERGADHDREMVGYMYRTCENTMIVINSARAETENSEIRQLAQMAGNVVREHVQYLTGTGLVGRPI